MKLYNSVGPNPHVVRMFMAERGIEIPTEDIDIMVGANRQPDYLEKNPHGQSPALFLDDGSLITEITAICEYLDETNPGDSLIGSTPEERAQTRRWTRWVDLKIVEPMTTAFRGAEGLPMFKDRMRCLPEASDGLKAFTQDNIAFLDKQMAGRDYVAGDKFTLADVLLFCFLAFGEQVGQPLNRDFKNVAAWFDKVSKRESVKA
ncbi:MAG TPA: glutathione S-transferase family protein [Henriciella marina]|uniref:glutathione S-transferase family protein n=1 Tax=Henriciella sp. TaxID=1968823 RepID=UPI001836383C|nr:glutathione S-transferase family protein [Henriciella sp.]HIG23339.1 glutathione S-transferase family protein [Henriciella sp.]HIK65065.1 glutathione S-transferase family protein [Henriciella marina]